MSFIDCVRIAFCLIETALIVWLIVILVGLIRVRNDRRRR